MKPTMLWPALVVVVAVMGCDGVGRRGEPSPSPVAPSRPVESIRVTDAAYLGPWLASPLPIGLDLTIRIKDACQQAGDLGGYTLAVVDARGEGMVQTIWGAPDRRTATCDLRLTADGRLEPGTVSTAPNAGGPAMLPTQIWAWRGWSEAANPGEPAPSSGLGGSAGAGIAALVLKTPGHQDVAPALAGGAWSVWVPWDLNAGATLVAFDASGSQVASEPVR